jgi:hypothetical protein
MDGIGKICFCNPKNKTPKGPRDFSRDPSIPWSMNNIEWE